MSWSEEGYNAKIAQSIAENADQHTEVAAMCRHFAARLKDYEKPRSINQQGSLASLDIGQQILASPAATLDPTLVVALKEIWARNQQKAKRMIALLNDRPKKSTKDEQKRRHINFSAVRALIQDESNRSIYAAGLLVGGELCMDVIAFLEEFFKVCQNPNQAEIAFISQMAGVPPHEANSWFAAKREKLHPLYAAKATIQGGPAAKLLRLKEHARSKEG